MKKSVKLALLGSTLALAAGPATAAVHTICAGPTTIDLPGGSSVPAWGYAFGGSTDGVCDNTPTVPGPRIAVPAGDTTLTINLTNTLPEPTSVVIPGLPMPASVGAGPTWDDDSTGSRGGDPSKRVRSFGAEAAAVNGTVSGTESYTWSGVRPGTFIYHSGTHPQKQVYMGLAGAVTQNAVEAGTSILAQAYPGVEYVNEVVLFYSEIDPDMNNAIDGGTHTTSIHYHPRWFLVNGAPYEDGMDPIPAGAAGSRTLLRFLSTAGETHVPVLQGMHMTIHAEDGLQYNWQDGATVMGTAPREQYSVMLPPLKTKDAIIRAPADGLYAVYDGNGYMTNPTSPDDVNVGDPVGGMLRFLAFGASANQAPVADPNGPYSGVTDAPVAFDGTGSTDDGAIDSYDWNFGDGSPVAVNAGPTPSHTYTSDNGGVPYNVTLTVTDDDGLSAAAATTATIALNQAPVANPNGPYFGAVGSPVAFDGTGSTDDSNIVSYAWDFGDGNLGSGATPSHTYTSDVGSPYTVTLTVTDDSGVPSAAAMTTATIAANQLPVAVPNGPYTGSTGNPVSFDGTGSSDPDGTVVSYAWDFGDGNIGVGATPSHSYAAAGIYTVELTVTDNAGGVSAAVGTTADISAANQPPVADACGTGCVNDVYSASMNPPDNGAVTFDGSGSSDPDGSIASYVWDFGDGNTGTGVAPSHTYAASSTYVVTLTVTDNGGATATDTVIASIVANQAPVAVNDSATVLNQGASVDINVTANDTDTDGTVDPTTVVITSDPARGTAVNNGDGTVTYTSQGGRTGTVFLTYTVEDDQGAVSNEATVTIIIIK